MRGGALLPVHDQFLPRPAPNDVKGPFCLVRGTVNRYWAQITGQSGRRKQQSSLTRLIIATVAVITLWELLWGPRLFTEQPRGVPSLIALEEGETELAPAYSYYDLGAQKVTPNHLVDNGENLLMLIPLRNAESVLDLMWDHLNNLTYPHELIDIAFLVSDCTDNTDRELVASASFYSDNFHRVDIFRRDFGAVIGQDFTARHGVQVQAARRKLMGRARNWLLSVALRPEHSWVMWRDADIERSPPTIVEDLAKHGKDVIVPNVWRPLPKWLGGQQAYDLNSWPESPAALELAARLDDDDVIVEGYAEYPTWRMHLAYMRNDDGTGDIDELIDLDGIGGVTILARARVFRAGANFPGFAFESHAETEGFGKMCKRMGFSVGGLTQYTIWHMYEPSEDDIREIENRKKQGLPID